ncbi:MAG: (Fe-S)-binding protein [Promethearchaeota archaeon]
MKPKDQLIEELKRILKENSVLIDMEDRYVYSFEKIFMEPAYPLPDIVVKVTSLKEAEEISELVEKEDAQLIKRGEQLSSFLKNLKKLLILLDDTKISTYKSTIESIRDNGEIINNLRELHRAGHGTSRNLALAIKTLFLEKTLNKCHQCTTCSAYCTVNPSFNGIETWSSKGRALLIRGMMKGELTVSKKLVDVVYTCTKCGLCFAECFQDLDLHEAIVAAKHYIAEKNLAPQAFQVAAKNIFDYGDPGANSVERRVLWTKKLSNPNIPQKADALYWVGCMVANRNPNTARAFFNVLDRANVDFTMLGEKEGCCGYVLLSSGLWNEAEKVAKEVIEKVEKSKAKTLVTPCSGCYYTFSKLYPEILDLSMPCETLHTSQFLEKMIKNKEIKLKPLDVTVTYHDPCSLGRHSKVYDAPRNVLKAIPHLKLIEMPHNRERARCCGGGGGLWTFKHRVSMDSAYTRLKEDLISIKINTLTSACPLCEMNFRFASRKSIPIEIFDITEMIELAMLS